MPSPHRSLRARWLGRRLKALRNRAGLTPRQAATAIGRDHTSVSRFENGGAPIRSHLLLDLLDRYGVTDPDERTEVLGLCDEVAGHGWWDAFRPYVDPEFADLLWVEENALHIRCAELVRIPGLLHTDAHARALIREDPHVSGVLHAGRLAELGTARRRVLDRPHPPQLSVVLAESALYQAMGGNGTRIGQLERLLELGEREHVDLRLLPLETGAAVLACAGGGFSVFELRAPYPAIGCVESVAGRVYLEDDLADRAESVHEHLSRHALDPEETARRVKSLAAGANRPSR